MKDENIVTSLVDSYGDARSEERIELVAFLFFALFLEDSKCRYRNEDIKKIIKLNLHDSYKNIGHVYFDDYIEFSDFLQNRTAIFMMHAKNLPKQLTINMGNSLFYCKPIIINNKNMLDGISHCSMTMEMKNAQFIKSWFMASKFHEKTAQTTKERDIFPVVLMIFFIIIIVALLVFISYL